MNQEVPEDHITRKTVVYRIPRMDAVTVRRNVEGGTDPSTTLGIDLYYPEAATDGGRRGAVVLVAGYPDPGMERIMGCKFKELGSSTSWARLIAASGLVAVTYSNREPAADIHAVLRYLRTNAASLGLDETRIGLLASSGHAPLALSVLIDDRREAASRCAVLICPLTLDEAGFTAVADAASTWRFANPAAGKGVADLPGTTPLFIARAGQDQMPGLNETLDRFIAGALTRNLRLTLINHPDAPHAFDLMHDSDTSREIIRAALSFMQFHLESYS